MRRDRGREGEGEGEEEGEEGEEGEIPGSCPRTMASSSTKVFTFNRVVERPPTYIDSGLRNINPSPPNDSIFCKTRH